MNSIKVAAGKRAEARLAKIVPYDFDRAEKLDPMGVLEEVADLLRGDMTADEMREIIRRKLQEEGLLPPPVPHVGGSLSKRAISRWGPLGRI